MASKKPSPPTPKLPLINISLAKLAFAVVVGSLLTITMFIVEHRSALNRFTIAQLIENSQTTVNLTINNEPPRKIRLASGSTVMDLLRSHLHPASLSAGWNYTVNGQPVQVDASRYALYDGDHVVWFPTR